MAASWGIATEVSASTHVRKSFQSYVSISITIFCANPELTLKHELGILGLTQTQIVLREWGQRRLGDYFPVLSTRYHICAPGRVSGSDFHGKG